MHEPISLSVPDAELWYWTRGSGPPVLVVAGGPGFGSHYLDVPLTSLLGDGATLTFYDQRGSGLSSGHLFPSRLTMTQFVEDLEAVRVAAGHKRVTLLGHSFGGLLAIQYTLAFPQHVRALVIVDGDPVTYSDWEAFREVVAARQTDTDVQRMTAITQASGWERTPSAVEEYFQIALRPYFGDPGYAAQLAFGFAERSFEQLQTTSTVVRADLGQWDFLAQMSTIGVPTLLIYGGASIFPPVAAERLAHALPNASLHVLPRVGHFPFLEAPEAFRALVMSFLKSNRRPTLLG